MSSFRSTMCLQFLILSKVLWPGSVCILMSSPPYKLKFQAFTALLRLTITDNPCSSFQNCWYFLIVVFSSFFFYPSTLYIKISNYCFTYHFIGVLRAYQDKCICLICQVKIHDPYLSVGRLKESLLAYFLLNTTSAFEEHPIESFTKRPREKR